VKRGIRIKEMHVIFNTIVILPKREVGFGGFFTGVASAEPPDFRLCWSKNNSADIFDSQ